MGTDNVAITDSGGTSRDIAADDVGDVKFQEVKLDGGGSGATVPIIAGQQVAAASLPVVLASDHSDVKVTLDSEAVVLGAGSAAIGKLAANDGVDVGNVDVASMPTDTFAADAQAYGKGVLIQGDDGTDRRAVLVDTDGHVKVDVVSGASSSDITSLPHAQTVVAVQAITAVAGGAVMSKSAEIDVSDMDEFFGGIFHAPDGTGTPTKGTLYAWEGSLAATGDDAWVRIAEFVTGLTASTKFDQDGTEAIGATVIEESATTGLTSGEWVFFKDATLANSEWRYVQDVITNTSFTISDGLTTAHDNTTDIYTKAEVFRAVMNVRGYKRLRCICDNNYIDGTTIAINWKAVGISVKDH